VSDYAIGDIQGCFSGLLKLLELIKFDEHQDKLWLVGDLVNRGAESLEVLRFCYNLQNPAIITLGNHDLYFLQRLFGKKKYKTPGDTLDKLLAADDVLTLGHFLRKQRLMYYDDKLKVLMSHAGLPPLWSLETALKLARELENVLQSEHYADFLNELFGNTPNYWQNDLQDIARWRCISNYLTRMRLCDANGALCDLDVAQENNGFAWFDVPNRRDTEASIVFGHWSALRGVCAVPNIYALDTGFVWGGSLTALRLQDKQRFCVQA
jgi:bis(5'-nucleosyl)-tetraphosphatase (symmetrical)